jgi:hypothetical protein
MVKELDAILEILMLPFTYNGQVLGEEYLQAQAENNPIIMLAGSSAVIEKILNSDGPTGQRLMRLP